MSSPGLARLLLGQPERGDVRRAERRARDVGVLERVRLHAGRVLDGDDALVGGLVGERGAAHDVADRVDVLLRRALAAVDVDQPAVVELDAGRVEAERLDVRAAAGGDHEPVGLALLVAVGERHRASRRSGRSRPACRCGSRCSASRARGRRPWRCRRPRSAARGRAPRTAAPSCPCGRRRRRSRRPTRRRRSPPASAGSSSSAHASSVPITRPPKLVPGTGLGIEPVAITTVLACELLVADLDVAVRRSASRRPRSRRSCSSSSGRRRRP